MKDFDSQRRSKHRGQEERTFTLGGETFLLKPAIHPSVLEEYDKLDNDTPIRETLEVVDTMILGMLDDGEGVEERWRKVRDDTADPISVDDLQELVRWILEVMSARPTGQPGDSSSGQNSTPTTLMGGSFSEEPEPVAS